MKTISKTYYLDKEKTEPVYLNYLLRRGSSFGKPPWAENIQLIQQGNVLISAVSANELQFAKQAQLADGRTISLSATVGTAITFQCLADGQPLYGSDTDPYRLANAVFWIVFVLGMINLGLGLYLKLRGTADLGVEVAWWTPVYGAILVAGACLLRFGKMVWPMFIVATGMMWDLVQYILYMSDCINLSLFLKIGIVLFVAGSIRQLLQAKQKGFF